MMEIRIYEIGRGKAAFTKWFERLNVPAALKVQTAITRMEAGNFSNTKSVGGGVYECKVHFGPGYRVYFGKEGEKLVILLAGGTKKGQSDDIENAKSYWKDYKARRRQGT